ncbi:MAG: DUF3800 domain-containing protein [Clostridia bacterium]|nr:DUF3800 domain-containing protein [Clostridia bacterium]
MNKILSVFIDESGDFGPYEAHSPYYIVTMVLHNQNIDINDKINSFEEHLVNSGYNHHAIHTAPLIRRESIYEVDLMENRIKLFNSLFLFFRKLEIKYISISIEKSECKDDVIMSAKLSRRISNELNRNFDYFNQFDLINIYYDNGQVELTKILSSVFSALFTNVDFRKVQPVDYKLFQVADLVCTLELLSKKLNNGTLSKSEMDFFGGKRDLNKNYIKKLISKRL